MPSTTHFSAVRGVRLPVWIHASISVCFWVATSGRAAPALPPPKPPAIHPPPRAAADSATLSDIRLATLKRLVQETIREVGISSFSLARRQILDRFKALHPDCPLYPLDRPLGEKEIETNARTAAEKAVSVAFPPPDKANLQKEAAARYPFYKAGDLVEVRYQPSPARQVVVRGVFRGKTPDALVIAGSKILFHDMEILDPDHKILDRFFPNRQKERRRKYIEAKMAEYRAARKKAFDQLYPQALAKAREIARRVNERRGYVFYQGKWRMVPDVVTALIIQAREHLVKTAMAAAPRPIRPKPIPPPVKPPTLRPKKTSTPPPEDTGTAKTGTAAPPGPPAPSTPTSGKSGTGKPSSTPPPPPQAKHANGSGAVPPASGKNGAPEPPPSSGPGGKSPGAPEDAGPHSPPSPSGEAASGPGGSPSPAVAQSPGPSPASAPNPGADAADAATTDSGPSIAGIAGIAGLVLLLGAAAAGILWWRNRPAGIFYRDRRKAESEFWNQVQANREEFKHVAWQFPDKDAALEALQSLSYIEPGASVGELTCSHPIHFGMYPEDDHWLVFVGGPALSHAMWREAVDFWSRQENGEQVKVSSPPEKRTRAPDPSELRGDAAQVAFVEEREGAKGDFSSYLIFHGPNKQSAMAFLRRVTVEAPGEFVVVETPEGHWGKDFRGIYRE